MKARLAIITPGGIGAGIDGQGFPALMQIVSHLSKHYEVDVYSHAFVTNEMANVGFHFAPRWLSISLLRWSYLKLSFLKNHFKKNYDLLFAFWGYPAGALTVMLGRFLNRPTMVYVLGGESAAVPEIKYGLMLNFFTRSMVLKTCEHATTLMALTNFQVEHLRKRGVNRKIEVIPFGADKKLFFGSERKPSDILKIVHVANITPVKDQAALIRAFAIIKSQIKAQLRIVGPDFMRGGIQSLAKELGVADDIEFVGWKRYNEIPVMLSDADCFMLTSLSEAQNDSITEAMMCGLLAVSTRVGIMADLGNEYGVVGEIGDHQSLAREVISVYKDPLLWKKRIDKSHAWALAHDLGWTLDRITEQIEIVVKPKS